MLVAMSAPSEPMILAEQGALVVAGGTSPRTPDPDEGR